MVASSPGPASPSDPTLNAWMSPEPGTVALIAIRKNRNWYFKFRRCLIPGYRFRGRSLNQEGRRVIENDPERLEAERIDRSFQVDSRGDTDHSERYSRKEEGTKERREKKGETQRERDRERERGG